MTEKVGRKGRGKIIALILLLGLVTVVLIHIVHALTLDRMLEYKEISFYSPRVTAEMNGYKMAFVSDIHNMDEAGLREIVEELNTRGIDLLILGGDYPSDKEALRQAMEILSQVHTTEGIFGVEGNHDRRSSLFAVMEEYNITPLSNNGFYVHDNLYLCGVVDLWSGGADISHATESARPENFVLFISHNPDITMMQATDGIDLILSGHTHGGQITFFGFFAPALLPDTITDYGHRFISGWSESRDGIPVYISNGVGTFPNVPRVFARPQVVLVTLHEGFQLPLNG